VGGISTKASSNSIGGRGRACNKEIPSRRSACIRGKHYCRSLGIRNISRKSIHCCRSPSRKKTTKY